jgi:transcriptional regulator with XRE-family HTH domain
MMYTGNRNGKDRTPFSQDEPLTAEHRERMATPARPDRRDAIAQRLDELREAQGLSFAQLERLAGVTPGTLSALHTGRRKGRKMPLGIAVQICHALGKKVGRDLLGEEELGLPLPDGMDLDQLSQREKDALIFHLLGEVLQRGLQIPPMLAPRSDDADES